MCVLFLVTFIQSSSKVMYMNVAPVPNCATELFATAVSLASLRMPLEAVEAKAQT